MGDLTHILEKQIEFDRSVQYDTHELTLHPITLYVTFTADRFTRHACKYGFEIET